MIITFTNGDVVRLRNKPFGYCSGNKTRTRTGTRFYISFHRYHNQDTINVQGKKYPVADYLVNTGNKENVNPNITNVSD